MHHLLTTSQTHSHDNGGDGFETGGRERASGDDLVKVLMAKFLGQPSCDLTAFNDLRQKWAPTKDVLRKECLDRKNDIGNKDLRIPNKNQKRDVFIKWLTDNPITDKAAIADLHSQLNRQFPTGNPIAIQGTVPTRNPVSATTQVPRKEAPSTGRERQAPSPEEGTVLQNLPPREIMARALGLPNCDYQQAPFVNNPLYTPSGKVLDKECQRRVKKLGFERNRRNNFIHPSPKWTVEKRADWLRSHVIHKVEEEEAQILMRRVQEFKKSAMQLLPDVAYNPNPTGDPWEPEPIEKGLTLAREEALSGNLGTPFINVTDDGGLRPPNVSFWGQYQSHPSSKARRPGHTSNNRKLSKNTIETKPSLPRPNSSRRAVASLKQAPRMEEEERSVISIEQFIAPYDPKMDEGESIDKVLAEAQGLASNGNGDTQMPSNNESGDPDHMVLMARALGLGGCDFQQDVFRRQKILRLEPTDEVLFAECKRRAELLGKSWRAVMIDWLVTNPIQDFAAATELSSQVWSILSYIKAEEARLGAGRAAALPVNDETHDVSGKFVGAMAKSTTQVQQHGPPQLQESKKPGMRSNRSKPKFCPGGSALVEGIFDKPSVPEELDGAESMDTSIASSSKELSSLNSSLKEMSLASSDVHSSSNPSTRSVLSNPSIPSHPSHQSTLSNPSIPSNPSNQSTLSSSQDSSGLSADSRKQSRIRGAGLATLDEEEEEKKTDWMDTRVPLKLVGDKKRDTTDYESDAESLSMTFLSQAPALTWSEYTTEAKGVSCVDWRGRRGTYTGSWLSKGAPFRPCTPHGHGLMVYDDVGITYEGNWITGVWYSHGKLELAKDDYYAGDFLNGSFCGHGVRAWPDGSEYEGLWEGGKRSGRGTYKNSAGDHIEGVWENDMLAGHGRRTLVDGSQYSGPFIDGIQRGFCKFRDRYGREHEGEWVSGRLLPDGSRYDGLWKDGRHGFGKCHFSNGDIYDGQYHNDKRDGQGCYTHADGSQYSGSFVDGLQQGKCRYRDLYGREYRGEWVSTRAMPDGSRYEGILKEGKMHGFGKCYSVDGDVYMGQYRLGKKEGRGRSTHADKSQYNGHFVNGLREGRCQYRDRYGREHEGEWVSNCLLPDGSRYSGLWFGGKAYGFGKSCYSDFDVYEGQYHQGIPHGQGRFSCANGDVYEGNFADGMKEGFGKFVWSDGTEYEGEWKDDKPHGQGQCKHPNGDQYEGQYRNGQRHGRGRFSCSNGDSYEGNFVEGKQEGYGKYKWSEGSEYEGEWKDDKEHGQGTLTSEEFTYKGGYWNGSRHGWGCHRWRNGTIYFEGEWRDGRPAPLDASKSKKKQY